uniref:Putative secreted protein n=1 Tax=Ixodes ricinus TaxID=34613 RepID=A0A6B0UNC8_IXORI
MGLGLSASFCTIFWPSCESSDAWETDVTLSSIVMSAPAMKQPGFEEMSTALVTLWLFSKSFRTASMSSMTSAFSEFTLESGELMRTTATPSLTVYVICFKLFMVVSEKSLTGVIPKADNR